MVKRFHKKKKIKKIQRDKTQMFPSYGYRKFNYAADDDSYYDDIITRQIIRQLRTLCKCI